MKKIPLLILFIVVILIQASLPLNTITSQYITRKYGTEVFEDIKTGNNRIYNDEHYIKFGKNEKIFLKKEVAEILKDMNVNPKTHSVKLKVKTLGEKRSIEDLIIEGIALKNPSKEDLELLKTRLSKQSESAQKNSDEISEK